MENRTNQVIELSNGKDYLVIRQVVYKGDTYYVTSEILNDGEDFDKELTFLREKKEEDNSYVEKVEDKDIIVTILKHIS